MHWKLWQAKLNVWQLTDFCPLILVVLLLFFYLVIYILCLLLIYFLLCAVYWCCYFVVNKNKWREERHSCKHKMWPSALDMAWLLFFLWMTFLMYSHCCYMNKAILYNKNQLNFDNCVYDDPERLGFFLLFLRCFLL